ncbi:MAG: GAF domain-containing sensor histidine kinase [Chloroflexi bacterium]|nr:GAF domain-containing sensor histidine kinase [Chloroflexota bacterium]
MDTVPASERTPPAPVDRVVFRVRWIVWLFAFVVAWIANGSLGLPAALWAWFAAVAVFNGALGLLLFFQMTPPSLAVATVAADTLLFGALPYCATSGASTLSLFSLFPAFVGAIRFGPAAGFLTGGVLAISLGARTLAAANGLAGPGEIETVLAVAGLPALSTLVGYLAVHERKSAVTTAAAELEELRHAMAGARLLFKSTDVLSLTSSYSSVLEGMLEAGVAGLPEARREDGPSVGIAFFFADDDPAQTMHVVANRNLDKRDVDRTIAGKSGIVAETLKAGNPVVFDQVNNDGELGAFLALQRCRSGVCYPLQAGLDQYGVVVLATPAPRRPSPQHLDLMRAFTSQAGVAFQNAKLYQTSRLEQDRIIHSENEMRQKLARDLHDGPTQKVAGLVMQLDYISHLLDRDPGDAKQELEKARATAQQTVKEIRTALFTLRPLALETKGLSAALKQYGERLRDTERLQVIVEPGDFGSDLDLNVAATVFAIVDEAVTNARKHAHSSKIYISAERRSNALVAVVRDEGVGFDVDRVVSSYQDRSSLGLQNMHDRAMLINGELRVDSVPGKGTRITLIVPLFSPTQEANN